MLGDADLLSAVSGGAYVAGAYASLGPASDGGTDVDTNARDVAGYLEGTDPTDPASGGVFRPSHHRYLENDPGGFVRAVLLALGCVLFNVVVVAATTIAVAWPVGRLLASQYVDPSLHTLNDQSVNWDEVFRVPARLWLPAAVVLGARGPGAARRARCSGAGRRRSRASRSASPRAACCWRRWCCCRGRSPACSGSSTRRRTASWRPSRLRASRSAASRARCGASPRNRWPRRRRGSAVCCSRSRCWPSAVWSRWTPPPSRDGSGRSGSGPASRSGSRIAFVVVDIQWFSMRRMYRTKLRGSFALRRSGTAARTGRGSLRAVGGRATSATRGPSCCSARRRSASGCRGTASRRRASRSQLVRSASATSPCPPPTTSPRSRRGSSPSDTISSWQATTGAAFSSAMGRFGYGSTNALLAALNIDLGAWLPNPRLVTRGYRGFPRVRLPVHRQGDPRRLRRLRGVCVRRRRRAVGEPRPRRAAPPPLPDDRLRRRERRHAGQLPHAAPGDRSRSHRARRPGAHRRRPDRPAAETRGAPEGRRRVLADHVRRPARAGSAALREGCR